MKCKACDVTAGACEICNEAMFDWIGNLYEYSG